MFLSLLLCLIWAQPLLSSHGTVLPVKGNLCERNSCVCVRVCSVWRFRPGARGLLAQAPPLRRRRLAIGCAGRVCKSRRRMYDDMKRACVLHLHPDCFSSQSLHHRRAQCTSTCRVSPRQTSTTRRGSAHTRSVSRLVALNRARPSHSTLHHPPPRCIASPSWTCGCSTPTATTATSCSAIRTRGVTPYPPPKCDVARPSCAPSTTRCACPTTGAPLR